MLGGVGWSTPYPGCFTQMKDPVPCVPEAGWALGVGQIVYKKSRLHWDSNCRPFSLKQFTLPRRPSRLSGANDVIVNNKFSDFHGGHFLVSYTIW